MTVTAGVEWPGLRSFERAIRRDRTAGQLEYEGAGGGDEAGRRPVGDDWRIQVEADTQFGGIQVRVARALTFNDEPAGFYAMHA